MKCNLEGLFIAGLIAILCATGATGAALKCNGTNEIVGCEPCRAEVCTADCKQICVCDKGYVRGEKGDCVPEIKEPEIPVCNKTNEYLGCRPCGGEICPAVCIFTCLCEKGFVRGEKGDCVPETSVPLECNGDNEEIGCEPCTSKICPKICKITCLCKSGFVRESDGVCREIKIEPEIPVCNKTNEYLGCRPCGGEICPAVCIFTCLCEKGFVRGEKGDCVPETSVPLVCNGDNEEIGCEPCTSKICPKICKLTCLCKFGFVRDSDGVCREIKIDGPICPVNEEIGCASIKPINLTADLTNRLIRCLKTCVCIKGYERGEDGVCRPIIVEPVCPINEEIGCDQFTLIEDFARRPIDCIKTCVCIKGYVRGRDGICRPTIIVEPVCPVNEEPGCVSFVTEDLVTRPIDCIKTCVCKKGYERGKYGVCRPTIIVEPVCPINEELGCEPISLTEELLRRPIIDCIKTCICIKGYVRGKDGVCRPTIIEPVCPINEELGCVPFLIEDLTSRPINCIKTCVCIKGYERGKDGVCRPTIIVEPVCPINEEIGCEPIISFEELVSRPINCIKTCVCIKGYVRGRDGVCRPTVIVEPVCPINEEPVCLSLLTEELVTRPINCIKTCVCKKGYERGKDGVCRPTIIVDPVCPINEEIGCEPITLSDELLRRPIIDCIKTCVCIKGYIREKDGVCRPTIIVDPVCPINEELGCVPFLTEDLASRPINCIKTCVCIKGYERGKDGVCRPTIIVEPVCPINEEFGCEPIISFEQLVSRPINCIKTCVCIKGFVRGRDGVCRPTIIVDPICPINEEISCAPIRFVENLESRSIRCIETCVCIKGYERGRDGVCRPTILEPVLLCNGTNEEIGCEPCTSELCTLECKLTCVCSDNYIRDENGECTIKTGGVKPIRCEGINEENGCAPCPNKLCVCKPECVCSAGFERDEKGECTIETKEECDGENEIRGCAPCEDPTIGCPRVCIPQCVCEAGFIRGYDGLCTIKTDLECKYNTEVVGCSPCQSKKCSLTCTPECLCIKGFTRGEDGLCIREK